MIGQLSRVLAAAIVGASTVALGETARSEMPVPQPAPPAATAATVPPANPIVNGVGSAKPTDPLTAPKPRRARAISPDIAAQLSAAAPKYVPPAPKPPPTPEEEQPDLREIDKPKNGIIRLPKYVVQGDKPPPVLTERAVSTRKGLEAIAMRRYITETDRVLNSLTAPLLGSSTGSRAMMMYEEDERLRNMADLDDAARMVGAADKAAGVYVKRQVDSTFMRQGSSFDWRPIGR